MHLTPYEDINKLILELLLNLQRVLGSKLYGVYLSGSLVIGDFDRESSDIDLVAALKSDLTDKEFELLKLMHDNFANHHLEWKDRIEVCYISVDALQHVKTQTSTIANISPGEPFHKTKTSKDWLMNWYLVRQKSIRVYGPDPKTIIEPILKDEFLECVKDHVEIWKEKIDSMHKRKQQAYAILTLCRAFYTLENNGEQVSKEKAAAWTAMQFPEYTNLIQDALLWRKDWRNEHVDDFATYNRSKDFVEFMIHQING